ncbi:MAG: protein phosphatase 2C domain-containing protein [Chromatocurvus sp.]
MSLEWAIDAAGATHPGQRKHNEDSWRVDMDDGFFIVADGVGGRDAGEVASRMTCDIAAEQVHAGKPLVPALLAANSAIREAIQASVERASSMASTAVALLLQPDAQHFSVAWAGDSRLYLWDGELKSLTRDHSLVESLLRRGEITRAEADTHPRKNVILVALGDAQGELEPGENRGPLPADALFLLCSDGLTDVLAAGALCDILSRRDDLQARADALVQAAVEAGGRDNITALLVSCRSAGGASPEASPPADGPVVYETFDPFSGERTRDDVEERSAPTIRRVPSRNEDTGTRPVNAGPAAGRAGVGQTPTSPRWRWRWWLAAVALVAVGMMLIDFVARQGL